MQNNNNCNEQLDICIHSARRHARFFSQRNDLAASSNSVSWMYNDLATPKQRQYKKRRIFNCQILIKLRRLRIQCQMSET